jgi:hypothetical protein
MRGMPARVNQNLFQNPRRDEWRTGHMEDAGIDHDQPLLPDDEALLTLPPSDVADAISQV